jgi:hypothetical protein
MEEHSRRLENHYRPCKASQNGQFLFLYCRVRGGLQYLFIHFEIRCVGQLLFQKNVFNYTLNSLPVWGMIKYKFRWNLYTSRSGGWGGKQRLNASVTAVSRFGDSDKTHQQCWTIFPRKRYKSRKPTEIHIWGVLCSAFPVDWNSIHFLWNRFKAKPYWLFSK